MKVLVATRETQGQWTRDVFLAEEGEPVGFDGGCDREACECHTCMRGLVSGRRTTTMRVVDWPDFTPESLFRLVLQSAIADGMCDGPEDDEFAWEMTDILVAVASDFPAGVIVEKDGYAFRIRPRFAPKLRLVTRKPPPRRASAKRR